VRHRKPRWAISGIWAAILSLALLAAACGSDNSGGSSAATSAAATSAAATSAGGAATTAAGGTATTAASASAATTASSDVCTADKKGGTLTMGMGLQLAISLDPTVAPGTGVAGGTELAAMYDTLMRYNPDTGDFEPLVAQSLTPNADLTQWTLKLRSGITFGNGDPLTVDAVVFSLKRMATASVSVAGMAKLITGFQVVDPLTVVLSTDAPFSGVPYVLATEAGMVVNPNVVNAKGQNFGSDPTGAGVGPYEFESLQANTLVALKAKTNYWGGPVCIDSLHFTRIPGGQGTYQAFQKGELDMMFLSEPQVVATAKSDKVAGNSPIASGVGFFLNGGRTPNAVLSDVRLRQAIAYALDPQILNQRTFNNTAIVATGLYSNKQLLYPGVDGLPHDAAKAASLLKESGFTGSVRLTCLNDPATTEEALATQALLTQVGFKVDYLAKPGADISKDLVSGDYDIVCSQVAAFDEGPWRALSSIQLRSGLKDPSFDAAVAQLNKATTLDQRKAAMATIQGVLNNLMPMPNFAAVPYFVGWQPKVHGIMMTREGVALFRQAYLSK
jgi:peptide/nickel transport system substrate-binding protein